MIQKSAQLEDLTPQGGDDGGLEGAKEFRKERAQRGRGSGEGFLEKTTVS